jgi:hypothetical protein
LSVDSSPIRVWSQPNRLVSEATSASFQGRTPAGKASERSRFSWAAPPSPCVNVFSRPLR